MQRDLIKAVVVLLSCVAPAARAQPAPAALVPPAWKQIYANGQITYYVDAHDIQTSGGSKVTSLLEYTVPQVIGGAQVWSMVTHMQLNCAQNQMMTTDNTLYALKMASGPAVQSQPANDRWHAPQPNSLGGLVWSVACGKP